MPKSNNSNSSVKKILVRRGIVVGNKMQKTIVVRIDTVIRHPVYKKVIRKSAKVKVHDEKNSAKTGDIVKIVQTRPISRDKRWKLIEVVTKNK